MDSSESSERPTIWILILALSVGGAERTVIELVNGIDRDRYDVVLWTVFNTNPLAEELADDITHRTLGVTPTYGDSTYQITGAANPLMYFIAPLTFVFEVYRNRPDILHSFLFRDNILCRIAGLVSPPTAVISGERGDHNSMPRLYELLDRLTVKFTDRIISNSRAGAQYYADWGLNPEIIRRIPNGRDLEEYHTVDGVGDEIRDELSIPPDVPVVGTVGRLVERKGHSDLLHAWSNVSQSHPEAQLLIVGYGPQRESLEATARELGVDQQVCFTGSRDDIPAILDMLDIFVFPSHWEGLPGAVQEAMAAGLPIVATDVNGTNELISDGETGLLVSSKTPTALAGAIDQLLSDRQQAAALGEHAQAVAFDQYTREAMVDRFEAVYEELQR
ncbi:glycosyltransferase [Halobaculum limi]|uniref:glycosyltransferase n=1 Tax=Halobaculum limi TaxID=3031916 RepID=UPI00240674AC|nr:glycosyltransferase [Halobaculum sp. YSMS11]